MIVETFEALEATTKRGDKEQILRDAPPLIKPLLICALDPYRTYHIQDLRLPSGAERHKPGDFPFQDDFPSWGTFVDLLDSLHFKEVSGNVAKEYVVDTLMDMPPEMRKWAARVLLKKLRCGVEAKTVNKVFVNLVPTYEVMLAKELDCARDLDGTVHIRQKLEFPVWVDRKLDGIRLNAFRDGGNVELRTRAGHLVETLPSIEAAVKSLPKGHYVLDGEVMGDDWNDTQSKVFSKVNTVDDSNIVFHIFDKIPLVTWKTQGVSKPYSQRRDELEDFANEKVRPVPGSYVHRMEELLILFHQFIEEGHEGAMVKDPCASYEFRRSPAILKVKPKQTWEGRVVGHEMGKGKYEGVFGAFKVQIGKVVTSVGGGFTDQQRKDITADLEDNPKCYWGAIAEVEAQEMTEDGKLRFPVFKRFRNPADK